MTSYYQDSVGIAFLLARRTDRGCIAALAIDRLNYKEP
jgi:hypothetical protein